jgi:hypothetical protein
VCGFDTGISGYEYRNLYEQTPEDIWNKINNKENHEKGDHIDEMDGGTTESN